MSHNSCLNYKQVDTKNTEKHIVHIAYDYYYGKNN